MKTKLVVSMIVGAAFALGSVYAQDEEKKKKPEGGKGGKGGDPSKVFEKLDSNADGKVTESEWMAGPMGKRAADAGKGDRAKEMFGKMAGEDGELTLEEFTKAQEARKKKGQGKGGQGGGDKKKKKPEAES
ncbi:MAG: hypothetical protein AAF585_17250 [Verrucomicrobiota bacterium]